MCEIRYFQLVKQHREELLQAQDEERLFERVREHIDREHPEKGIVDEHVHNLIEATAHDAEAEGCRAVW